MNLEWRVINPELRDPAEIIAIDEVLHRRVADGRSQPTLIFYQWQPSVSIAKPQRIEDLNLEACRKYGIKVVRTTGGGRAVLHLGEKDISYSLFSKSNGLNHIQIYALFCGKIAQALKELRLPVEINNVNDFYVNGKKISGNALRLGQGGLTQHGILLYDEHPAELMISLMNPELYGEEDLPALRDRLTSIRKVNPRITLNDLISVLKITLTDGKYREGKFTEEEIREIRSERRIYEDPNWYNGKSVRGLCWLSKGEPRGSLRGN